MKAAKGYLYNHKGKVVVNPRLMPDIKDYHYPSIPHDSRELAMSLALAEWESNNIEVENVYHSCEDGQDYINRTYGRNNNFYTGWQEVSFPIPCLYTVNEKAIVTELI